MSKLNIFGVVSTKDDNDSDDGSDDERSIEPCYEYPCEKFKCTKKSGWACEPEGTQWIHDKQIDDVLDEKAKNTTKILEKLMKLEFPPQRSEGWFALRHGAVTASDGGIVVHENHYEMPYKILIKKIPGKPFEPSAACYHGTKYEQIATMIYEYRMNVKVVDFGLIRHPKYSFLAASPDGIIGHYKHDGKHLTKYVGRMLEIKCPVTRPIKTTGEIRGNICPSYYWVQVQLQLECCNLNECDFWQCKITEYESKEAFLNDTNLKEPFRSKQTGMEKGCLIQIVPMNKHEELKNNYWDTVYECAKFIHPPKIEMSPYECDKWIAETMVNFDELCLEGYCFDSIKYWRAEKSKCVVIKRDKQWFAESLPIFQQMWKYVEYLREERNEQKSKILFEYIDALEKDAKSKIPSNQKFLSHEQNEKLNNKIMNTVKMIYDEPDQKDKMKMKIYLEKIAKVEASTKLLMNEQQDSDEANSNDDDSNAD